jgi:large subunit ribosomal protein L18
VVRKTNTGMIVQVVNASVTGDMTVASAVSPEISNHGWSVSCGNMPAAYLTGLLAGLRAKSRGVEQAVLDIGLNPPVKGSKIYAALAGALDAGLSIAHNPDVLPDGARLSGEHIVAAYNHFAESTGDSLMFSKVGKKKTTVASIPRQFKKVKKALLEIPKAELKKKKKRKATPAKKAAAKKPVKKAAKAAAKKPVKKAAKKPAEKAPRAVPRKPKPKKLLARRGKK